VIKLTVLYDRPSDVEAFEAYYMANHVPLARKVPGLNGIEVTLFQPGADGSLPKYHLMAELTFDDAAAMQAALGSEEGKALGADVANFPGTTSSTHLVGVVA
jgi:uncharacterized protein (TIGR02118 family)